MNPSALHAMCHLLNCSEAKLAERLNHPEDLEKAEDFLRSCQEMTTNYKQGRRGGPKHYSELSKKERERLFSRYKPERLFEFHSLAGSAKKLYAYQGFLGVTVQQHYYCRHRIYIKHADLPCIVRRLRNGQEEYYPLEVVRVRPPRPKEAFEAEDKSTALALQRQEDESLAHDLQFKLYTGCMTTPL
ncbi:hypothetical protein AAVH_14664 [Aphelenchoides avenae]|nr:hypothetical protein AAVH_14664 [Aphelenchus avenae]